VAAAGIVVALVAGVLVAFWLGGLVLAALLAGIAVARLLLPVSALGPLAVRSRSIDVVTSGLLAAGIAVLAVIAPGGLLDRITGG
jgi:hypothetical protein